MSAWKSAHALDEVAQKWRTLAEKRHAHFLDLQQSGRWKHYYDSERQILDRLRETARMTERWAAIAPRPADQVFREQARSAAAASRAAA
jgi:hypothetical protein